MYASEMVDKVVVAQNDAGPVAQRPDRRAEAAQKERREDRSIDISCLDRVVVLLIIGGLLLLSLSLFGHFFA